MNRKHTAASYLALIDRLRAVRADLALSGDFIVGFPGETEADFAATLALVEAARYGTAFTFKYSTRPGTPAAERDQVPEAEKDDRLQRLQSLIDREQKKAQAAMVGQEVGVLFEKPGRMPGQMTGKSDHLHAVHVTDDVAPGDLRRVRIVAATSNSLAGEILA
jgi:tRNA-2-methylthio-N6-dimethylallyladenosine synthase